MSLWFIQPPAPFLLAGSRNLGAASVDNAAVISDAVAIVVGRPAGADTAVSLSESVARAKVAARTASDTAISFSDSAARAASAPRTTSDTALTFTDSVSRS